MWGTVAVVERWRVGQVGDPIYRAAAAILGIHAQVTDCGEIPGRFPLREQRTRAEEGDEADRWGRASRERSGRGLESDAGERRPARGGASWAAVLGR